jgi:hypothetical protein
MSDKFSDDEVKQILGEAARLAVEKADREASGHSYEDISAAAEESGIDPNHLIDAAARVEGRYLFVRDEQGDTHVRKLSWNKGEPGRWRKYVCPIEECTIRQRCPLMRWDHVITSCEDLYQIKRSVGAVSPKPAVEGPLLRTSPNGRYVLFGATYGPLIEGLFTRFTREFGIRCQEALGIVDLRNQQSGLLLASTAPLNPIWTGPATFRFDLNADTVSIRKKGTHLKLLARLFDRSSQIFVHLGDEPANHALTRVDAYRVE